VNVDAIPMTMTTLMMTAPTDSGSRLVVLLNARPGGFRQSAQNDDRGGGRDETRDESLGPKTKRDTPTSHAHVQQMGSRAKP